MERTIPYSKRKGSLFFNSCILLPFLNILISGADVRYRKLRRTITVKSIMPELILTNNQLALFL